jgi:DNA-binding NarL/FixJ family response regulator
MAERLAAAVASESRPPHEVLSDRELQVLLLLARGKSVKEIGVALSLSEKTISTYRSRLLEKMNMRSNAELMRYALRAGLVE